MHDIKRLKEIHAKVSSFMEKHGVSRDMRELGENVGVDAALAQSIAVSCVCTMFSRGLVTLEEVKPNEAGDDKEKSA